MIKAFVISALPFMCLFVTVSASASPTELVLGGLRVMESKPSGASWDAGFGVMTRPDLIIEVSIHERVIFTTPKAANTHSATQVISSPIFSLNEEVTLVIKVIDKDLRADDLIDVFTLRVTPQTVAEREIFKFAGKSVISLSLQLKPANLQSSGPPRLNVFSPSLKRDKQTVHDHIQPKE